MSLIHSRYFYMGVVAPACVLIPIAIALPRYARLGAALKAAAWYMYLEAAANLITSWMGFNRINNMPAIHAYTVIESIVLCQLYKRMFSNARMSRIIDTALISYVAFAVVNAMFLQSIFVFCTYTKLVQSVGIMFLAIMYFKKMLDNFENKDASLALINSGVLIYFTGSFTVYTMDNFISANKNLMWFAWNIHATMMLAMYLLFASAFLKFSHE